MMAINLMDAVALWLTHFILTKTRKVHIYIESHYLLYICSSSFLSNYAVQFNNISQRF